MIYYIDPAAGPETDGRSPEQAKRDVHGLVLRPGDRVLFRRGRRFPGGLNLTQGSADAPITYGAYGEGALPLFTGSIDLSEPEAWEAYEANVWVTRPEIPSEVGNVIFSDGAAFGTLCWELQDLSQTGDWYDNRLGAEKAKESIDGHKLFLYSEMNPGETFKKIEVALRGRHRLVTCADWTICEDLAFENSGIHAIRGAASHMTIRRCTFRNIGGCVWSREKRIRLGNAIEFWNRAEHNLIEDCYFDQIYDSCITHQGNAACTPAVDLQIRGCLFMNYGMAAFEGRDCMPVGSSFQNNVCLGAGGGFSGQGDSVPRNSEIYPLPMGHHIFLWRMEQPSPNGSFRIENNVFGTSLNGAAIYSMISKSAESQVFLRGNQYAMKGGEMLARIGDQNFKISQMQAFRAAGYEPDAQIADLEDNELITQWRKNSCLQKRRDRKSTKDER